MPTPDIGQPVVRDTVTPGLGLRLSPGGTKTFILYKKVDGRPRRIKLGKFPDINVETARQLAQKMNGKIADGIDPVKERRENRAQQLTLGEALTEYEKARKEKLRPKTLKDYRRMFETYFSD